MNLDRSNFVVSTTWREKWPSGLGPRDAKRPNSYGNRNSSAMTYFVIYPPKFQGWQNLDDSSCSSGFWPTRFFSLFVKVVRTKTARVTFGQNIRSDGQ